MMMMPYEFRNPEEKDRIFSRWNHCQSGEPVCRMLGEDMSGKFSFAEIGSQSCSLCELVLSEFPGSRTFAIDTSDQVGNRKLLDDGRFTFIEESSLDAHRHFSDGSLDVAYIDTDPHEYPILKREIALWFPKVRVGGLMVFHDYGHPDHGGVAPAVDEFCRAGSFMAEPFPYFHVRVRKTSPSFDLEGFLGLNEDAEKFVDRMVLPTPLSSLAGIHSGRPGYVMGSGPSLAEAIGSVDRDAIVFACNGSVKSLSRCDYFCMADSHVMNEEFYGRGLSIADRVAFFFPLPERKVAGMGDRAMIVKRRPNMNDPSFDCHDGLIICADTVHCACHLAFVMGCSPIYLCGIDCRDEGCMVRDARLDVSYGIWKIIKERNGNRIPLKVIGNSRLASLFGRAELR